jgi:hypothetical protein
MGGIRKCAIYADLRSGDLVRQLLPMTPSFPERSLRDTPQCKPCWSLFVT